MNVSTAIRVLGPFIFLGAMASGFGCYECVQGHSYGVAAQYEVATVGQIVNVPKSRKGTYEYVFTVNGIKMDDFSKLCFTPLAPGACYNYGPVRVYYSYRPYPNSLLEDFSSASSFAYRVGKFLLEIGRPPLVLCRIALASLFNRQRKEHKGEPDVMRFIPDE